MSVYIPPEQNNYFFANLFQQLQVVPQSGQGYLFAYHNHKGFFVEKKPNYNLLYTIFYNCVNIYSFEKNSARLIDEFKKITNAKELIYASKCAKKIEYIAKHREQRKNSAAQLSIQFFTLYFELLNKAAVLFNESNVEVACRFEMFDAAIELIEQGAELHLAAGYYDPLLILACKTDRYSLAMQLVTVGAHIDLVEQYMTKLLLFSLEQKLESVAIKVIKAGADCKYIDALGCTLLEKAISQKLPQIALQLIAHGGVVDMLDHTNNTTLLELALTLKLEAVALKMIESELNLNHSRYKTILHTAIQHDSIQVLNKILEKIANPNTINTEGDSPLHLAFRFGKLEMAKSLLAYNVHLIALNKKQETPLKTAFTSPEWNIDRVKMETICSYFFQDSTIIKNQIKKYGSRAISDSLNYYYSSLIRESENNTQCFINPFQIAFFLQDANLCANLAGKITRKQFTTYQAHLQTKYPNTSMDFLILSTYKINRDLLRNNITQMQIPNKPENIVVSDLLSLFDTVNFSNSNANDYYNPKAFSVDTGIEDPKKLRVHLEQFINRINKKTSYIGTPASGTQALKDFYDYIERAVTHVIQALQLTNNSIEGKKETAKTVIEFLRAAGFCGGRYYATALKEYNRVVRKILPTFEAEIIDSLGSYREIILQSTVRYFDGVGQNVHDFNQLMHALGQELGIPGAEMMASFQDHYGHRFDKDENRKKFFNIYTATSIVNDWIDPQIKNDVAFREKSIDWLKAHIPMHWGKGQFEAIRVQLAQFRKEDISLEKIKTWLENEHKIFMGTMTPEEAIEDERRMCYLATSVIVDMNAEKMLIQKPAIAYMLEKMGILSTVWGNSSEEGDENQVAFYWPFQVLQGFGNKLRRIFNW